MHQGQFEPHPNVHPPTPPDFTGCVIPIYLSKKGVFSDAKKELLGKIYNCSRIQSDFTLQNQTILLSIVIFDQELRDDGE